MGTQRVIGVDLGGTKIATGLLDADGRVEERHEVPTPTVSQEELLEAISAAIEPLASRAAAIGFGIPSVLDRSTGRVLGSTNIPLRDIPLAEVIQEQFGLPVAVENDGNAAAFGEWRLGAGRRARDLVMLTLGTGVGGGIVIGGDLFRGIAELGHVVVVADGPPCQGNCNGRGHLEAVASGSAADRAAEKLWGEGATSEQLVGRAGEGDAAALEALSGIGHLLGAAIGSFLNIFAPEVVVVGGGFGIAASDFLFPPAVEVARREAVEPDSLPLRLVRAELGAEAGLVGAGLLAFEALGAD
ncbi:MAG: ROK family protein [Gaiellaceae bacterium]